MKTFFQRKKASDQYLDPNSKAQEWENTIARGTIAPPQPAHPAPSPLASPFDLGDLRKKLTREASGDSTTLNAQSSVHGAMTNSAGKSAPSRVESQHPATNGTARNNVKPPVERCPSQPATDYFGEATVPINELSSLTLPGGSPGVPSRVLTNDNAMPAIIATDTPNPLSIEDRRLADNGLNDENRLWLRYSPAGFHITDFVAFMRSPYKAPAKRHPAIKRHADDFNEDPKQALLAYNNSRESDRVCPVCYTWFRVGENPFENPDNFEQFIHRPYRQVDEGIDYMKQRTGRCGPVCDEVYLHCSKTRIDRRLRQICTEATLRRSSSWRRIKFWRKVPTPPEGIAVMVANNHEQEAGTRIVFIRKEMLQRSLV